MRISVAVGALPMYPLQTTLAIARDAGADGVEIMLTSRMCRDNAVEIRRAAERSGIPILSAHAILRHRRVALERKIADDRASIRFSGALPHCEAVVLHPPLTGPGPSPDLNRWLNAVVSERDSVNPSLRLALENRAENYDGVEPQWLDDLDRMRSIVGEWSAHITFDLAHAASRKIDLVEAVGIIAPRIANVHVSDAQPKLIRGGLRNGLLRDHQIPGDGVLPIGETLGRVVALGYTGPLTLEFNPLTLRAWRPGTPKVRLARAIMDVRMMTHDAGGREASRPAPRQEAL